MSELAWQVPLGALAVVFSVRLVLPPYWMYRKADTEHRTLEVRLDEGQGRRRRGEAISRCIAGGTVLQERLTKEYWQTNVMNGDPLLTELDEWDHETLAVLRDVATLYADYFARDVERKSPEAIARGRRVFGGEMLWFQVGQKLDRLTEILKRNNAGEVV